MKKTRKILLIALLIAILVPAGLPAPVQAAAEPAQTLVRFTVVNKSTSELSFRLEGPQIYTLRVGAESTKTFTLERGEYTYWVQGCGMIVVSDKIDLTTNKRMVMPVCGGRARQAARAENSIDLSEKMKLVKIEVVNDTGTTALAILTGPSAYVFRQTRNQDKFYTVAKGSYDVVFYACGTRQTRHFEAYKGQVLKLECR